MSKGNTMKAIIITAITTAMAVAGPGAGEFVAGNIGNSGTGVVGYIIIAIIGVVSYLNNKKEA